MGNKLLIDRLNNVNALQFFQLFRYGSTILISIFLTKSGLETADISTYEWLLFIGTIASFFWVNAFLEAILPIHPKLSEDRKKVFSFNVFLLFVGMSCLLFLIFYFGGNWIVPNLTGRTSLPFYELFCWYFLFNFPATMIEYLYLLHNKRIQIIVYGMIAFGLQLLVVIVPLFLGMDLEESIRGLMVLGFLKFCWLLYLMTQFGQIKIDVVLIKKYLILAAPLMVYALFGGSARLFDNWLVGWYYEAEDAFAIFRYGAKELPLATALVGGLYTAMVPAIARDLTGSLSVLKSKTRRIFHWLFPISIVLMLTSHWFFPLVFNPEFKESAAIFNVYLLVMLSRVIFPYTILMGLQKTKVILFISIGEKIINIIGSLLLLQYFGLIGIAFATVFAFLFEKIAMALYLFYNNGIAIQAYTDIKWYSFYAVLLVSAYVISLSL